ncbi:PepSY domain-containing protein [Streptomyces sp. NPDC002018]|uniref:PepSY domain-containing protein n=1 Tax=Streptomyces sp. NPDC002018 TaxID=3364629 RepID=UPI0036B0F9F0
MKRNLVIAAITAAALIGGGTYTAVAVGGDDSTAGSGTATGTSVLPAPVSRLGAPDDSPRVSRAGVTAGQAADAALKKVPGTVVSVERDDDGDDRDRRDGRWEVDVLGKDDRRHELKVDAGGTVRADGRADDDGDDDDDRDDRAALRGATVDARQAADAALAAVPGTATSVEIDDDRTGHWEVGVRGEDGRAHELKVHARTGKVTADRADDRDDDRGGDDRADDAGGRHGDDRDDDGRDD